jgi:uncharacterized delta-60 repeat protein
VGSDEGDILNERKKNPTFGRPLVGLLLFVGVAGFTEASAGVVITDIGVENTAVVIDSLGRIVTAGGTPSPATGFEALLMARYNADGSLDTTFGNGGLVTTDLTGFCIAIDGRAVAIDKLGRIIVAGSSIRLPKSLTGVFVLTSDFLVIRYNSDGSLDGTFGDGGIVTTNIGGRGCSHISRVAIDSLGKIVVGGTATACVPPVTWGPSSMALARYNSDGSLDAAFGDGGIVTTDVGGHGQSGIGGVAIDSLGRIVVAGSSSGTFMLARYNADGSLDNTFGGDSGIVAITNIGGIRGPEYAATVAMDSLGRIIAGGEAATRVNHFDFALVRCNSDGSLDTSFGNGGTVTTRISGDGINIDDSAAKAIVIDSLGRIIGVGVCPSDCGAFDFELARYNSDGSLDNTFGNGGLVTNHFGDAFSGNSSNAIAIDSLGRIVVAGFGGGVALARYNPDGSLDNTFGEPTPVATSLQFDRSNVAAGFSYRANFSGVDLTYETFFDVRFTAPGSNDSVVVLNWQKGLAANHSVPAGTSSGVWNINGVRAHKIETDHSGNFAPVSAMIMVSP